MSSLSAGYTQFCIAGLQESSPEEPNMYQKLLAAGSLPWTSPRSLQRFPRPVSCGEGAYRPSQEPHLGYRLSPSGFQLALFLQC